MRQQKLVVYFLIFITIAVCFLECQFQHLSRFRDDLRIPSSDRFANRHRSDSLNYEDRRHRILDRRKLLVPVKYSDSFNESDNSDDPLLVEKNVFEMSHQNILDKVRDSVHNQMNSQNLEYSHVPSNRRFRDYTRIRMPVSMKSEVTINGITEKIDQEDEMNNIRVARSNNIHRQRTNNRARVDTRITRDPVSIDRRIDTARRFSRFNLNTIIRRKSERVRSNNARRERGNFFKVNFSRERSNIRNFRILREGNLKSRENTESRRFSMKSERRIFGLENDRRKEGLMMRSKRELKILNDKSREVRSSNGEILSQTSNMEISMSNNRNGRGYRGRIAKYSVDSARSERRVGSDQYSRKLSGKIFEKRIRMFDSDENRKIRPIERNNIRSDWTLSHRRILNSKSSDLAVRNSARNMRTNERVVSFRMSSEFEKENSAGNLFSSLIEFFHQHNRNSFRLKNSEDNYRRQCFRKINHTRETREESRFGTQRSNRQRINSVSILSSKNRKNEPFTVLSDNSASRKRDYSTRSSTERRMMTRDIRNSEAFQKRLLKTNINTLEREASFSRIRTNDQRRQATRVMSTGIVETRNTVRKENNIRNSIENKENIAQIVFRTHRRIDKRLLTAGFLNRNSRLEYYGNKVQIDNFRSQIISKNSARNRFANIPSRFSRTNTEMFKTDSYQNLIDAISPRHLIQRKNSIRVRIDYNDGKYRRSSDSYRINIFNFPSILHQKRLHRNSASSRQHDSSSLHRMSDRNLVNCRRISSTGIKTEINFEYSSIEKQSSLRKSSLYDDQSSRIRIRFSRDHRIDRRDSRILESSSVKSSTTLDVSRKVMLERSNANRGSRDNIFGKQNDILSRDNTFFSFTIDVLLGLIILAVIADDRKNGFVSRIRNCITGSHMFQHFLAKA